MTSCAPSRGRSTRTSRGCSSSRARRAPARAISCDGSSRASDRGPAWHVVYIEKRNTSLRRVTERILAGIDTPKAEALREELARASSEIASDEEAMSALLARLDQLVTVRSGHRDSGSLPDLRRQNSPICGARRTACSVTTPSARNSAAGRPGTPDRPPSRGGRTLRRMSTTPDCT